MIQEIQRLNPVDLSDPSKYGFAHITVVPAGSTLVCISGQFGEDKYGNPVSNDFTAQLKQSCLNLCTALAAVGATPEQHDAEKQRLISIERNAMWLGKQKPTSTLIPVPRLAEEWMLFEIDAVVAMHS